MNRKRFNAADLIKISDATHEEILVGDFVRLASGSPLGVVRSVGQTNAEVTWLTTEPQRSTLPWVCLRQAASRER